MGNGFPKRAPDLNDKAQAWQIAKREDGPADWNAGLRTWLVHCSWAHPFWHWYYIALVHLRDIPGAAPAKKHYPEAEYELIIMSLDPGHPIPNPDARYEHESPPMRPLEPPDLVEQFHGVNDLEASRICDLVVQTICKGELSPDQDFRSAWKDAIAATVEHFRSGGHAIN